MGSNIRLGQFKSNKQPTWCPGCGAFGIMNSMVKALASTGNNPDDTLVIAGVGCSGKTGTDAHRALDAVRKELDTFGRLN